MKIEKLTEDLFEAYEAYVLAQNHALFYHSILFYHFLKKLLNCTPHYLVALEEGHICGVLPLMKQSGLYGTVYNSLPFYGSNGSILSSNPESFSLLLKTYQELIQQPDVATATLVTSPFVDQDYSDLYRNRTTDVVTDRRTSQVTRLIVDREALLKTFDGSARRNIQKALNSGIAVSTDWSQVNFLYEVHLENMREIGGRPKPEPFFTLLNKVFKNHPHCQLYVAKKDQEPIAALLLFYYNKTVEYYIPVIKESFRSLQPLALIIYQAMCEASSMGYRWWNWGGTWLSQKGVYQFKKKWGAIEQEYQYHVSVRNPSIYGARAEALSLGYPYFFVIPFHELRTEVGLVQE